MSNETISDRTVPHAPKARLLVWTIGLGFLLIAGLGFYMMARDISEGHWLKPIVIGGIACVGGWRAYKQAKASAKA